MGIGLVLLIWTLLFGAAAVPFAALLARWSWQAGLETGSKSMLRAIAAGILPYVLIGFGLLWFFGYWVYCDSFRRVDPGLGDYRQVPVGKDYVIRMTDSSERADIMREREDSRVVRDILQIAQSGEDVLGIDKTGPFVFDTVSGGIFRYSTTAEAVAHFAEAPQLLSTSEFYDQVRFNWQDKVALCLLLTCFVSISFLWYRLFIRPRVKESVSS